MLLLVILVGWGGAQSALWAWDAALGSDNFAAELWALLRLDGDFITDRHFWKPITYALIHANGFHFLLNVMALYFAGRDVEPIMGRRQFLAMILIAWVVGGFASWGAGVANGVGDAEVVGFSAAAAAIIAAYSTIMPELELRLNVFYLIPLRFRAKFFALGIVVLASVCVFFKTPSVFGPAGILAGSIIGWAWTKQLGFGNPLWIQRLVFDRRQRESRRNRMSAAEFVALEVDPILDRITRSGTQSLTRAEWKILEQGRIKLENSPPS